ncbi:MAG: tyrosine-type recombinase/integrase [Candidatus Methanosuratus sp.]|nr:tyrosine-type recombinase/integrase [Candidatus Methanosuratincola sp.]
MIRNLATKRTIQSHLNNLRRFLIEFDHKEVDADDLQKYLFKFKNKNTYRNHLSTLRVYFREVLKREDLVSQFKFPSVSIMPKIIPSKEELRRFYEAIFSTKEKALFLMFASSGLRRSELLDIKMDEVDFERRALKPRAEGETKGVWVSFYNQEAEEVLREYLKQRKGSSSRLFPHAESGVKTIWKTARVKTGLKITPQVLREWFAQEMSNLGVPERYIDAFCGRMPRTVLARHYTDYSLQRLKEVYDKAGLRVLS